MIKPTVGRVVLLTISAGYATKNHLACSDSSQPLAAQITYVHNDRMVNLTAWDHNGKQFGVTSVRLLQDDEVAPELTGSSFYCEWMPYQKGQAAKNEELESELKVDRAENVKVDPCIQVMLQVGTMVKINGIPVFLEYQCPVRVHPANVPLIFPTGDESVTSSASEDVSQEIAKGVVFVADGDGHNYYVPKDKLSDFDKWLESEEAEMGETPDWATGFDGQQFVVDIISEI